MRDKVTQVLMNLLGNALKFTPADGQVTVTVATRRGRLGADRRGRHRTGDCR